MTSPSVFFNNVLTMRQTSVIKLDYTEYWLKQGLHSLSGKTSYRKISWSLEAARFWFKLFQSLLNMAGTSAAALSNFSAIRPLQHPISRLRDFTIFGGKTSFRLVNRGPGSYVSLVKAKFAKHIHHHSTPRRWRGLWWRNHAWKRFPHHRPLWGESIGDTNHTPKTVMRSCDVCFVVGLNDPMKFNDLRLISMG